MKSITLVCCCWLVATLDELCVPFAPRISLGYHYANRTEADQLWISFNTNHSCNQSYVRFWESGNNSVVSLLSPNKSELLNMTAVYSNWKVFNPNFTYSTWVHTLILSNLEEGEQYSYEIFGNYSLEPIGPYNFTVPYRDKPNGQRVLFFGDMDSLWVPPNNSAATFDWLQDNVQRNYDMIVFLGDMAYDMEDDDCIRGDFWMRNISVFTPYLPMQVSVGNHDAGYNREFTMVRTFFKSPELSPINPQPNYYNSYSWNLGLAHFINFNPYLILFTHATPLENLTLYNFILNDLTYANQSRAETPWIVVVSHYAMYCSDSSNSQCLTNYQTLAAYTQLFQDFHVDLYIGAYQHSYERDKPLFNLNVANYTSSNHDHTIDNAQAPVYIVEGAAGNNALYVLRPFPYQFYTDSQSIERSVGRLTIVNSTCLEWEQVDTSTNRTIDFLYLTKPAMITSESISTGSTADNNWWVWVLIVLAFSLIVLAIFLLIKKKCADRTIIYKKTPSHQPQNESMQQIESNVQLEVK